MMPNIDLTTTIDKIVQMGDKKIIYDLLHELLESTKEEIEENEPLSNSLDYLSSSIPALKLNKEDFISKKSYDNLLLNLNVFYSQIESLLAHLQQGLYSLDELKETKGSIKTLKSDLSKARTNISANLNQRVKDLVNESSLSLKRYVKLLVLISSDEISVNLKKLLKKLEEIRKKPFSRITEVDENNFKILFSLMQKIDEIKTNIDSALNEIYEQHSLSEEGRNLLTKLLIDDIRISYQEFEKYKKELQFLIDKNLVFVKV